MNSSEARETLIGMTMRNLLKRGGYSCRSELAKEAVQIVDAELEDKAPAVFKGFTDDGMAIYHIPGGIN